MEEFLSVKEFADATERFPNQIYDLINKGNRFRKLKASIVDGKTHVPESELKEFPFNAEIAAKIEARQQIESLEQRITTLEKKEKTYAILSGEI